MSRTPGLGDIMKQAQELQERLSKVQEEASTRTVDASAGGGMVKVTVNGRLELVRLQIEPQVISGGDAEMLQDLILVAVNEATRKLDEQLASNMGNLTGGLSLPGLG